MSGFEERADLRRRSWKGGRAGSHEELAELDLRFWREASGSDRLTAIWLMALESLTMKGEHEPPSGFQGSAFGVRRR